MDVEVDNGLFFKVIS